MKASKIAGAVAALLTLALSAAAGEPAGQMLAAGAESTIALPLSGAQMKVFLPTNYKADTKWPAVFFYPGQGGKPSTGFIRHHTDDRDFIVVGLPYVTPESDQPQPNFASREAQTFRAARQWLAAHASLDEARVYLGGVSKGGWTTSLLGEPELPRLAGLIIVLAGRSFPWSAAPGGAAYRGKPIYIGDGETDNNMRPARQAATFFQRQGAALTFEEYLGLGHATPPDATRLRTWLQMQARYPVRSVAAQAELGPWFTKALATARATTDVGEKFRLTLDLIRDPRLWLCGPPAGAAAQELLKEATARPPAKEEWAAETTYWNLLWKVTSVHELEDLRSTRDGFKNLIDTYPASRWGRLAAEDYRVLADAYERTAAAKAASATNITTRSGVNNRGIPVPRQSGNKIIFER
jgi:hypothetical protein